MGGKQMEGDNRERREVAKEARAQGKAASEVAGTLGSSQQRTRSAEGDSHQKKLDLGRQGKQPELDVNTPEAKPRSRDPETPDRERHPRL